MNEPSDTDKVEKGLEALRLGQALAVVPLVGNVLEHWESLPNDLKDHIREIDEGLEQAIDDVQDAMEHHEPAVLSSASSESEYVCKCGVRVTPHRCQNGTQF